ncbi:MAG: Serine--tRNA ligase [Chlamydiae bacterium]|nr:Serine--tRNA ligase [Chlamydiota bacterium]
MLDIKLIRKDPKLIEDKLKTKDPDVDLSPILTLDEEVRLLKTKVEEIKSQRNLLSKEIGEKKRSGEDTTALMKEVSGLGEKIEKIDKQLDEKESALHDLLARLPNIPDSAVKVSQNIEDNVVLKSYGEKSSFDFSPKNHVELNERLHLFDFKRAAKASGSNWPAYRDNGAKLEWALLNYMLDIHQENGFQFWLPPLLVRPEIVFGSGQLPKFEHQLFKIHDEDYHLYLIPTSEVALMGLHHNEILDGEKFPLRYVSYTPCFRREAGGLGAQERGLIRMHQFNKVEMFAFTTPEQSDQIFAEMLASAEELIKGLGLHFQTTELVTGDMSFAASKTIDLEVWLPGQDRYYEVSSISHCNDFQARRSNTRFKIKQEKPELCHTLNGSGLATSRLMVALLENNQREDGSVEIPIVLHKYLNGMKELTPT